LGQDGQDFDPFVLALLILRILYILSLELYKGIGILAKVGGIGSLDEAQALDPLNISNPGKVLP